MSCFRQIVCYLMYILILKLSTKKINLQFEKKEMLDEGVYSNTTAKTTMEKEDAAYHNRRNHLDSSGYDATRTIGRITGNKPIDDNQTLVYTVRVKDKIVSIPVIRLAPVSRDYCNQPGNEDSRQ